MSWVDNIRVEYNIVVILFLFPGLYSKYADVVLGGKFSHKTFQVAAGQARPSCRCARGSSSVRAWEASAVRSSCALSPAVTEEKQKVCICNRH